MQKSFQVGSKTFVLDQAKAEAAFAAKKVINGRETMTFNLLPLKYQWAYDLYRKMKANHWEPEDIPMGKDIEQWRDEKTVSDIERWIIRMGIGYFSAAEGIVGDNIQHVVRELVTAPELKLVLGRHAHEENIHADSLLYMIASLQINPHECEAMFEDIPTIVRKNEFVTRTSRALRRDLDLTQPENKRLLAKNIFIFGQTVEEVQALRAAGYNPWSYYEADEELRAVLDWLGSDYFVKGESPNLPAMVRASLLEGGDPFMVLADFRSYCDAQAKVDAAYRDKRRWAKMAILNTARVGKFSSDRSIRDYAEKIWKLKPVSVE